MRNAAEKFVDIRARLLLKEIPISMLTPGKQPCRLRAILDEELQIITFRAPVLLFFCQFAEQIARLEQHHIVKQIASVQRAVPVALTLDVRGDILRQPTTLR